MCTYQERHGCSYLAYDIILLPERERERETEKRERKTERQRWCLGMYLRRQIVLCISMVRNSGRDLGSGSN